MTCPLLYRFRVIDRLPEPPTTATARGTLVHAALERLFDLPAADRTPAAARALLTQEWDRLAAEEPDLAALFDNEAERSGWLASATAIVDAYFTLEDPRRLEPAEREAYVETTLESGLRLRGYIDRLDVAPSGDIRIVDYKTGRAPREAYEASALFQMKFYALVIWRLRGQVPRLLQLMYLAEGEVLRYSPDESDLLATERKVAALWKAIERARDAGRLAAAAEQALRLVQPQGAVPRVRRHPAAAARVGARRGGAALASGGHPRAVAPRERLGQDDDQQGEGGQGHRRDRRPCPPGRDRVLSIRPGAGAFAGCSGVQANGDGLSGRQRGEVLRLLGQPGVLRVARPLARAGGQVGPVKASGSQRPGPGELGGPALGPGGDVERPARDGPPGLHCWPGGSSAAAPGA